MRVRKDVPGIGEVVVVRDDSLLPRSHRRPIIFKRQTINTDQLSARESLDTLLQATKLPKLIPTVR